MSIEKAYDLLKTKLEQWLSGFILLLPNLLIALFIVLLFWVIGRVIRKLITQVLSRLWDNEAITHLVAAVASTIVLLIGLFIALGVLNLDKTVTSLLAGAGIIGIALGFAFQDMAANFISGIILSIRRPFKIGDIIDTNGFVGSVQRIQIRTTQIVTPQGQTILIPNKEVFQKPLTNFSEAGTRRIDLRLGVGFGEDLERVRRIVVGAVSRVEPRVPDREVDLFYEEFGPSSISLVVRLWIPFKTLGDFTRGRSQAMENIKAALEENHIVLPFPTQSVLVTKAGAPDAG
jgi:small conductance mechanosensitive channel